MAHWEQALAELKRGCEEILLEEELITKLKQGKYTFNIDLMLRYSGSYVLNPAKAEMMYFPVFYGREGMKKIGIN